MMPSSRLMVRPIKSTINLVYDLICEALQIFIVAEPKIRKYQTFLASLSSLSNDRIRVLLAIVWYYQPGFAKHTNGYQTICQIEGSSSLKVGLTRIFCVIKSCSNYSDLIRWICSPYCVITWKQDIKSILSSRYGWISIVDKVASKSSTLALWSGSH